MKKDTLPKITKKKKFNTQKFITLAKRVRKYFEEEKEYLQKRSWYDHQKYFISLEKK